MRLLRLLAAGALIGGAVVFLKRLMEEHAQGPAAPPQTEPAGPKPTRTTSAPASPGAASSGAKAPGSSNGDEATKAELYERAQELGIEGRSKMSKRELQRAIEAAG